MGNVDKTLNWMMVRVGKVEYSMSRRNGPQAYDCSSAVFASLIEGNFLPLGTQLGNTETLFGLVGSLLKPIKESEVERGDLFIQGTPGHSLGAGGHTGFALNNHELIHCCDYYHGIAITPMQGWTHGVDRPTHWYRLMAVKTQKAKLKLPEGGFKALGIGQMVTIRRGMTHWQTGERPYTDLSGTTDRIVEVKPVAISGSKRAYLLKDLFSWILEQDLVEAWPATVNPKQVDDKQGTLLEDHRLVIEGQMYELIRK